MDESQACAIAPIIPLASEKDVLPKLKRLSSAEEFFAALGVPYDAGRLAVTRMHILKRMADYLGSDDLDSLPDGMVVARARSCLERAWRDFEASSPLELRVFKVLKRAVAPARAGRSGAFVPLDDLEAYHDRRRAPAFLVPPAVNH